MPVTPPSENTIGHWTLYTLAVAEDEGDAPLTINEIRNRFPFDTAPHSLITVFPDRCDVSALIHRYVVGNTRTKSYQIADGGIRALESLGPPTAYPRKKPNPPEPLDLHVPAVEHTNFESLDKLKANFESNDDAHHLYRINQWGELVAICAPPGKGHTAPRGVRTVTPVEVQEAENVCKDCTLRHEVKEWLSDADKTETPVSRSSRAEPWWEKYDTHLENYDLSDDDDIDFPDSLVDDGKVYVAHNYTGQKDYDRKLHAHKKAGESANAHRSGKHTLFDTPCSINLNTIYDELERMPASTFLRRSDSCDLCKEHVREQFDAADSSVEAPAKTVDVDPFNVFESDTGEMGQEELEAEYLPDEEDTPIACPDCGQEFDSDKGLTLHWSHPKSSCDYPVPSKRERELLTALYLTGGAIEGKSTPNMRKSSVNIKMLRWFYDRLGIWASSLKPASTSERQSKVVAGHFGYEGADSQQQYRLTTRTCPWLEELVSQPLEELRLTPLIGRCLYSVRGYITDKSIITIRHKNRAVADLLEDAGFEVRAVRTPDEGKNQYTIRLSASASREFADWIGQRILPGYPHKKLDFREANSFKEGPRPRNPERDATTVETPDADTETIESTPNEHTTPDEDPASTTPETDAPTVEADTDDTSDTEADTSNEREVIGTVNLEPEWEWVGVQLYKMGMEHFAIRAFNKDLTPAEVYSKGGIADMIYSAAQNSEYNLDIEDRFPGSITQVEAPVSPDVVESVKQDLGVA